MINMQVGDNRYGKGANDDEHQQQKVDHGKLPLSSVNSAEVIFFQGMEPSRMSLEYFVQTKVGNCKE